MNRKQNSRDQANGRVLNFLIRNNDELITVPLYAPLKTEFDDLMQQIGEAKSNQIEEVKPKTFQNKLYKKDMALTVYKYVMRALVNAKFNNNTPLVTAFSKSISFIAKAKNLDALGRATGLKDLIVNNIGELNTITPDDIAEMELAISKFKDIMVIPTYRIKMRKATGTDLIPGLLNAIDAVKKQIGKLIHSWLPHLAAEWDLLIKVGVSTGIRHTSIILHFTDAETETNLKNIKVTLTNDVVTIKKKSTARGWVRALSMESGNWTATCESPYFHTHIITNIPILYRKIARFEIQMRKINE